MKIVEIEFSKKLLRYKPLQNYQSLNMVRKRWKSISGMRLILNQQPPAKIMFALLWPELDLTTLKS